MDPLFNNLFDDPFADFDDFERQPRRYRPRFDFEALTEREVIHNFRLRRETISMLEARIHDQLQSSYTDRRTDLTPLLKLLIALR